MKLSVVRKLWLLVSISVIPLSIIGWLSIKSSQNAFEWVERVYLNAEKVNRGTTDIIVPINRLRQLSLEIVLAPDKSTREKLNIEQSELTKKINLAIAAVKSEETSETSSNRFNLVEDTWQNYVTLKDYTVARSLAGYREEAFINVVQTEEQQFNKLLNSAQRWSKSKIILASGTFENAKNFKKRNSKISIWIFIFSAIALIILGTFIARSIIIPVAALKEAALRLQRKEKIGQILPGNTDELGQLGLCMEEMAHSIEANNDEMEKKNAELDQFAYTVSHDLKSPLVTIQGFLGLVEESALSGAFEQMKTDMTKITKAVHKMRTLLDELLSMSRAGRLMNEPVNVSLLEIAKEAVENVAGQIKEKNVEIKISPNLPNVLADKIKIQQVFQNLIDNAVKYMGDQPKPEIEIGMDNDIFFVKDNGKGIDAAYQEKIFNLFYRIDNSTSGSGIGMSLVKRIIETHNGRVWVESKGVGMGSIFKFTLNEK